MPAATTAPTPSSSAAPGPSAKSQVRLRFLKRYLSDDIYRAMHVGTWCLDQSAQQAA